MLLIIVQLDQQAELTGVRGDVRKDEPIDAYDLVDSMKLLLKMVML